MISTPECVRDTLGQITGFLQDFDVCLNDRVCAELALAEILNNIVEHAYPEQERGWIIIELLVVGPNLVAHVTDGGFALPGNALPPVSPPLELDQIARENLPEGGWGWHVIRSCAAKLIYNRIENENRLTATIPLTPA